MLAPIKKPLQTLTYPSLVRRIVEYACPIWHAGLPKYLQNEVETIQKRALTAIYGLATYEENRCSSDLVSLKDRCVKTFADLFKEMCKPDHKLNHLIPKPCEHSKSLRNAPPIGPPPPKNKFRTNCYRDTFIPYTLMNFSNFNFDFTHKWQLLYKQYVYITIIYILMQILFYNVIHLHVSCKE